MAFTAGIVMQAPGPNIAFGAAPSGSTYFSDANGLVVVSNANLNDQLYLVQAGCLTLVSGGGGLNNLQTGTSYTVQPTDCGQEIICTNAGAFALDLPNFMGVGFFCYGTQGGAGQVTGTALSGASVVGSHAGTSGQYFQIKCVVVSNTNGTNAVWAVMRIGT